MFKKLLLLLLIIIQAGGGFLYAKTNILADEENCRLCGNIEDFLNKNPAESARRKALLEKLFGVLGELGQAQSAFVENGDFMNIFAAAYYNTTALEIENILGNQYTYPAEKMEMMMGFYDAYRYNRSMWDSGATNNVEPQWLNYFTNASKFNDRMKNSTIFGPDKGLDFMSDGLELMKVLDSGIQAHVGFDLPRAIRNTNQNKVAKTVNRQTLSSEFLDSNRLFAQSMEATNKDVSAAIAKSQKVSIATPGMLNLAGKMGQMAESVIGMRENALKLANSNEKLPTAIRPQPTTNHQNLTQVGKAALEKLKKECEACPVKVEISVKVVAGKPTGTEKGIINGKPAMLWDVPPFGPPDIVVCVSENNAEARCTAECSDSYTCVFSDITLSGKLYKVIVIDADLYEHDLIGENTCQLDTICIVGQAQVTIKQIRK